MKNEISRPLNSLKLFKQAIAILIVLIVIVIGIMVLNDRRKYQNLDISYNKEEGKYYIQLKEGSSSEQSIESLLNDFKKDKNISDDQIVYNIPGASLDRPSEFYKFEQIYEDKVTTTP